MRTVAISGCVGVLWAGCWLSVAGELGIVGATVCVWCAWLMLVGLDVTDWVRL